MFGRETHQESRNVVYRRADRCVVPVDESRVQTVGAGDHKDIDGPQIAMQQCLGAAPFLECLCALRQFIEQFVKPLEQPVTQLLLVHWGLTGLECVNGIAHVGFVEVDAQVAAMQPDFSNQGMSREACVYPGDQINGGFDALTVRFTGIKLPLAQVVVHMPDAVAGPRSDTVQHGRSGLFHADGRQPPSGNQFVAPGDLGLQSLHHYSLCSAFDGEAQAEHATGARL